MNWDPIEPVVLTGQIVRLEALTMEHLQHLTSAASHEQVWTYLDEPTPSTNEQVKAMIDEAVQEQKNGQRLPFAIIELRTNKAIGSISYIDIQQAHRGIEIGWAWITPSRWQTGVARDAAFLLMRHAFETLDAIRVAFKADSRNERSRHAIQKLGATEEGTLRNHRILRDGHIRHSVYYSVIASEWPSIRSSLQTPE